MYNKSVGLVFCFAVANISAQTPEAKEYSSCVTKSCISIAAKLLESIDSNTDPCDDFHQYACGGWIDNNEIPEDKSSYGTMEILQDKLQQSLKHIFEGKTAKLSGNSDTVNRLLNVYQACLNETKIEELALQPALIRGRNGSRAMKSFRKIPRVTRSLTKFLADNVPWPVVSSDNTEFNGTAFDLVDALLNASRYADPWSGTMLIAASVAADQKNSAQHIIQLDQASLGMPSRDFFLKGANDTIVRAYLQYMKSVGKVLLLAQRKDNLSATENSNFDNQMADILNFEIKLATIMTPREDRRDPNRMYNNMTILELMKKVPGFDWLRFLQATFAEVNIVLDGAEVVNVVEPEYFKKLFAIIAQTPPRAVANYLGWRAVDAFVQHLTKDVRRTRLDFQAKLTGVTKEKPRWITCVEDASSTNSLDMVAARLYVEKNFDQKSKKLATEMMQEVQQAFEQQLVTHNWMETKEHVLAKQKVTAMAKLIAYPENLLNDSWLNTRYVGYVGVIGQHFENQLKNKQAYQHFLRRKLRQPVDRLEFAASPAMINAYYDPTSNNIVFLAAIMQPPFFQPDQPMSLNYGGIGSVMGHELTHGFDDQGRHYDADGKLNDWWSEKTSANYANKKQCLIDQFNNFTINGGPLDGQRLNGITTQGENIADLGGLRQSFLAYRNWLAKQQQKQTASVAAFEHRRLPGLHNYTDDQLFFLGNALSWCTKTRPEALKLAILSDSHSPEKYRINGPVANMPEFAQAFSCSLGSRMNPEQKCRVW